MVFSLQRMSLVERPHITLEQNSTLHGLCEILTETKPDWDKVIVSIQSSSMVKRRGNLEENLRGVLLEQHISLILWDLIRQNLGVYEIGIPPDGVQTDIFRLHREDEKTLEYRSYIPSGELHAEYDALVGIGAQQSPLISVIESTSLLQKNLGGKYRLISPSGLDNYFRPLVELFNCVSFGYILCVLNTVQVHDLPRFSQLSSAGGMIVQIPASHDEVISVARSFAASFK